jgi:hypothetical protein
MAVLARGREQQHFFHKPAEPVCLAFDNGAVLRRLRLAIDDPARDVLPAELMIASGERSSWDTAVTKSICSRANRWARWLRTTSIATVSASNDSAPKLIARSRRCISATNASSAPPLRCRTMSCQFAKQVEVPVDHRHLQAVGQPDSGRFTDLVAPSVQQACKYHEHGDRGNHERGEPRSLAEE